MSNILEKDSIRMYSWDGVTNFGDAISREVVSWVSGRDTIATGRSDNRKLLAIGSILEAAEDGDVVWGSGIRSIARAKKKFNCNNLDIRSVRGPMTREFLLSKGFDCPEAYGDPAILMPLVYPKERNPKKKFGIIPHYLEAKKYKEYDTINVTGYWKDIIDQILECEIIYSSSLHGIIVAESYGITSVWMRESPSQDIIKYRDYYAATGRADAQPLTSLKQKALYRKPPQFDTEKIIRFFPKELRRNFDKR